MKRTEYGIFAFLESMRFLEQKATIMGATVLPSSVRPCSSDTLSTIEDTALPKTVKPWHPEF